MIAFDLSPQVRSVADRLIATPIGELVTHEALSDAVGQNVLDRRHWLQSGLRVAQREAGAVFVSERGIGYHRLKTEDLPGVGVATRRHIRVSARRASKSIVAGLRVANDVSEPVKRQATAELATLGLVEHLSRDKQVARHETEPAPEAVAEVARTTMMRLQQTLKSN